jgi:hypothetical protein
VSGPRPSVRSGATGAGVDGGDIGALLPRLYDPKITLDAGAGVPQELHLLTAAAQANPRHAGLVPNREQLVLAGQELARAGRVARRPHHAQRAERQRNDDAVDDQRPSHG